LSSFVVAFDVSIYAVWRPAGTPAKYLRELDFLQAGMIRFTKITLLSLFQTSMASVISVLSAVQACRPGNLCPLPLSCRPNSPGETANHCS
jgi:hypothetical protein